MRKNHRIPFGFPGFFVLVLASLIAGTAWAETVELVTYFPSSGGGTDPQFDSLRVGPAYAGTPVPGDGVALVFDSLGIGIPAGGGDPAGALEVRGAADVTDQVLFLPGANTAAAGVPAIRVGIGTNAPNEQLEITRNFRLPATTATAGSIFSGPGRFIHNFGTANFFAGVGAGNVTLTGNQLTGVGVDALNRSTSGAQNTAVGYGSLMNTENGDNNTAVGSAAISGNTIGSDNTAVGVGTLGFNSTGSGNTAVGFLAGTVNTGGVVPANGNAAGSNNTFLGFQAGPGADIQLDNATALGANALVSASNALVLGGTGANAVNVGIGTPTPTAVASPANAQTTGNLDVNDVFIHSTGRWASQGGAGFPAPNYDSGWIAGSGATWTHTGQYFFRTLMHNLNTLDTFVFVEGRRIGETQTHQLWYGLEDTSGDNQLGLTWENKTATQITLQRGDNDGTSWNEVRVRMWRIG